MTSVRLEHITKTFGATVALDDVNLEVAAGELFFLLGPSGCGKSTLLRLIAGLHEPTKGRIYFNDRDVTAPSDIPAAVDAAKKAGRPSVLLQVRRNGRNSFVAIKITP